MKFNMSLCITQSHCNIFIKCYNQKWVQQMLPGNKINNLGELTMNMVARNMLIALSVAGTLLGGSVGVHAATVNTDNQPLAQTSLQTTTEGQTAVNDGAQASNGAHYANATGNVSSNSDATSLEADPVNQAATPKAKKTVSRSTEYREIKTNTKVKKTKRGTKSVKQQVIRKQVVNNTKKGKLADQTTDNSNSSNQADSTNSTQADTSTNAVTPVNTNSTTAQQNTTQAQPTITPAEAQANQDAQNQNIQLQPQLTQSQISANKGQAIYDITGAFSNVVGQGTAIVNSICEIISTIRNLL